MKKFNIYYLLAILSLILSTSCEDVIEVDPGFEEAIFVVDAWINNMEKAQTIRLTQSQNYFDSDRTQGVTGATVTVTRNDGVVLEFEDQGNGDYIFTPGTGATIGEVSDQFTLNINANGQTYTASATMNRVPDIDSIGIFERENEFGFDDGKYASLYVRDFVGTGDTYWARTWKNDTLLNKPLELNLVFDAAFNPGTDLDGVSWIRPLREAINPLPDEDEDTDSFQVPYVSGDHIYCEVHAINRASFDFMQIAFEQMTNGNNAIFTIPVANTISNISSSDPDETVLGIFDVAAVSTIEIVVE